MTKRLGVTTQDLDAAKFAKEERIRHELAQEFEAKDGERIANILEKIQIM